MLSIIFRRILAPLRGHSFERLFCVYLSRRNISSSQSSLNDEVGVGYGPFSSTVKSSTSSENQKHLVPDDERKGYMEFNRQLRGSLARVRDPSSLSAIPFRSEEWKSTMVQLYRTVLRLHNKPLAVSLSTSLKDGPQKAMEEVFGRSSRECSYSAELSERETRVFPSLSGVPASDIIFRYLLTDDQRMFGNSFLKMQFEAHMDADSVTATNFYASWYDYIIQLASGITQKEMTDAEKKLLSDDQKGKLDDLKSGIISLRESKKE